MSTSLLCDRRRPKVRQEVKAEGKVAGREVQVLAQGELAMKTKEKKRNEIMAGVQMSDVSMRSNQGGDKSHNTP